MTRITNLDALPFDSPLARRVREALKREGDAQRRGISATAPGIGPKPRAGGDFEAEAIVTSQKPETPVSDAARGLSGRSSARVHRGLRAEEALHRAIVALLAVLAMPGVVGFHPANGGLRTKAEAGRLKAMGTVAGVPDLIVLVDGRAHGLEVKTPAGRMSPAQKLMAARFVSAGAPFVVVRSIEAARGVLQRWGAIEGDVT